MAGRLKFVRDASVSGWCWLVELTNHAGAAAILLAIIGVSVFSGWKLPHWWLGALILAGCAVLLFGEGAYRVWRDAQDLVAANAKQRDEALAELEELTTRPRPSMTFSVGEGPEYMRRGFVEELPSYVIAKYETPPTDRKTLVFKATETNGAWARHVRVRIIEAIPPPLPGRGSLPAPLKWKAKDSPETCDIPPNGHAYITLVDALIWESPDPEKVRIAFDFPIFDWYERPDCEIALEAFDDEGVIGHARFRIGGLDSANYTLQKVDSEERS